MNSALFGIAVTNGVYYYWYEYVKSVFEKAAAKNEKLTTLQSLLAAAIAGIA